MSDQQLKAVAGLGLAVGLVVVARQLARSRGAVLGMSPAMAQALVAASATAALASYGRLQG